MKLKYERTMVMTDWSHFVGWLLYLVNEVLWDLVNLICLVYPALSLFSSFPCFLQGSDHHLDIIWNCFLKGSDHHLDIIWNCFLKGSDHHLDIIWNCFLKGSDHHLDIIWNCFLKQPFNFIKKILWHRWFSCEFCEVFKHTLFTEHLPVTASVVQL